jgi:uncharacterized protein involved in exopolysaccharide biosynthesis
MSNVGDLFRKVLVFIGDLNRMEIRLDALQKKAKELGVEIEDAPESEKTINRLRQEANALHNHIDNELDKGD